MARRQSLYTATVQVCEEFLGPAAERFMRRQISTHLKIAPEKLQDSHMEELVEWVSLTFAVLTEDKHYVEDFSNKLLALARQPQKKITKAGHVSNGN